MIESYHSIARIFFWTIKLDAKLLFLAIESRVLDKLKTYILKFFTISTMLAWCFSFSILFLFFRSFILTIPLFPKFSNLTRASPSQVLDGWLISLWFSPFFSNLLRKQVIYSCSNVNEPTNPSQYSYSRNNVHVILFIHQCLFNPLNNDWWRLISTILIYIWWTILSVDRKLLICRSRSTSSVFSLLRKSFQR